ncbi:hypothetical protein B0H19DRAFT_1256344 [Mycena capillaripes]|nr:hypothetical protein B0H19DRAFT_1256344 [Mycena capillaripes]
MSDSAATISIPDGLLDSRIPQSKVPDIPPNWHESWHSLHSTLRCLEEGGLDPHSAILGLVHAELVREDAAALDKSSLIHLDPHLRTNYVPTVSERKVIKQYCEQGSQQIARISATIQRDTSQLASSSGRLAALHELVDPYLALLSPIRGIPPEILQEIFVSCLPTRHCAITHAAHVPLVLGSVCRIWREISLSTPALWSSVHIVVPHTIDNHPPVAYMEGLRLWLLRSGGCPLTISIFVPNGCELDIHLIVDLIIPYSHRWKSLKLELTSDEGLTTLWNLMPKDIPLLETLKISDAVPEQHALRFLSVPPNLRHLALKYFQESVSLPACSWERITSLCRI